MKFSYIFLIVIIGTSLFCSGCQHVFQKGRPFPSMNLDSVMVVPMQEQQVEIITVTHEIKEPTPVSQLIEDFYYVPLETTEASLFAYCNQIELYGHRIFVFDRHGTEKLFIFSDKGKFLKSLGEKGEAPFEFFKPGSFAIDREKDQLVIYDNMKRKWMRFTLDGKFIASIDVPFTTICNFQILPSGEYVTATHKTRMNTHLGQYADYRILYTDSTGVLRKAAYDIAETEHSALVYDPVGRNEEDVFYVPIYLNEVYTVTDTALTLKYKFDYSDFNPFEKEKMGAFESYEDFRDYRLSHTYVHQYAENDTHLMFVTSDKDDYRFVSFYDKRSKKLINLAGFYNDTDFVMDFGSGLYSYKDYFMALVSPSTLRGLKMHIDQTTHYSIREDNKVVFENLKEDDNLVLVFFKIKDL